jgi:hypothetical protein
LRPSCVILGRHEDLKVLFAIVGGQFESLVVQEQAADTKEKCHSKIWLGVDFGECFPEEVNERSLPFDMGFASKVTRHGLFGCKAGGTQIQLGLADAFHALTGC